MQVLLLGGIINKDCMYVCMFCIYIHHYILNVTKKTWNWTENYWSFNYNAVAFLLQSALAQHQESFTWNREPCSWPVMGWLANEIHDCRVLLMTCMIAWDSVFFAVEMASNTTLVPTWKLSFFSSCDAEFLLDL